MSDENGESGIGPTIAFFAVMFGGALFLSALNKVPRVRQVTQKHLRNVEAERRWKEARKKAKKR